MNYYQLLGIDSRASKNDIKKAYRKKAVEFHPDINKSPEASDVFKKIKIAYDNLYDDTLRMLYDRSLVNIINSRNIYTQVYKKDTYGVKPTPVIIEPRNVVVKGIEFLDIKRKPDSFSNVVYTFNLNLKNVDLTNCYVYPVMRVKGLLLFEDSHFQFIIKCPEHKGNFWIEVVDLETDYIIYQIGKLSLNKIKYGARIPISNMNRVLINFLDRVLMGG